MKLLHWFKNIKFIISVLCCDLNIIGKRKCCHSKSSLDFKVQIWMSFLYPFWVHCAPQGWGCLKRTLNWLSFTRTFSKRLTIQPRSPRIALMIVEYPNGAVDGKNPAINADSDCCAIMTAILGQRSWMVNLLLIVLVNDNWIRWFLILSQEIV